MMLKRTVFCLGILLLWGQCTLLFGDSKELRKQMKLRAKELVPYLSSSPSQFIPPITDRSVWDRVAATPEGKETIARAEQMMNEPILPLPEEVYKEYFTNGNRSHAEGIIFQRNDRWMTLARAELYENKGRFLPALEETLKDYCDSPSWILPAHDPDAKVYDGEYQLSELVSTHTAASLAIIRQAMKTVLSQEIYDLIAENLERRILQPYIDTLEGTSEYGVWWIAGKNNWNPVCYQGTIVCVLALLDDPERKAYFIAAAEYHLDHDYMGSFPEDGYCSEGIGYWNYGFRNYCALAETLYRETQGQSNPYAYQNVRNVTLFALRMELIPGVYPSIADCAMDASPSRNVIGLMSARLGLGLKEYEKEANIPDYDFLPSFMFHPEALTPAVDPIPYVKDDTLRSDFYKAGVLICRPPQVEGRPDPAQFFAVFKGGTNAEHHNHNDLGSFSLLMGKNWLVSDPGRELYTKRTFSDSRYEGELLSSIGHSVPRIAGVTQWWGEDVVAEVVEKTLSDKKDSLVFDITSAYVLNPDSKVDGLDKILRRFDYERAEIGEPNRMTVTDQFQFSAGKGNLFESPLITFADWEILDQSSDKSEYTLRLQKEDDAVIVTIQGAGDGQPLPLELTTSIVAEHDPSADNKPTRLAFASVRPVENGTIQMTFAPAK